MRVVGSFVFSVLVLLSKLCLGCKIKQARLGYCIACATSYIWDREEVLLRAIAIIVCYILLGTCPSALLVVLTGL